LENYGKEKKKEPAKKQAENLQEKIDGQTSSQRRISLQSHRRLAC